MGKSASESIAAYKRLSYPNPVIALNHDVRTHHSLPLSVRPLNLNTRRDDAPADEQANRRRRRPRRRLCAQEQGLQARLDERMPRPERVPVGRDAGPARQLVEVLAERPLDKT